jgi:Leucine-rich repeat (LRR) protein
MHDRSVFMQFNLALRLRRAIARILIVVLGTVLFVIFTAESFDVCNGPISQSEYNALEILYDATNGPNWCYASGIDPHFATWTFPSNRSAPCAANYTWQGLTCSYDPVDPDTCHIKILFVDEFNLRGQIPSEIVQLSQAEVLVFSSNDLFGTIPTQIATMDTLTILLLDFNQLTGTLPSELISLTNLVHLVVNSNLLTGTIAPEFGAMQALEEFDVGGNLLFGSIPTELGQFYQLLEFLIYDTSITGTIPTELAQLTLLNLLDLSSNQLSGTVPTEIYSLNELYYFQVDHNLLSGTISTFIEKLSAMDYFDLASNILTGTLPAELWTLTTTVQLVLANNQLTGTISEDVASLALLTSIIMNGNLLTGVIPSAMGTLTKLEAIILYSNYLSSSMPSGLGGCSKLESISIADNYLTGSLPVQLGSLNGVRNLNISNNLFEGNLNYFFHDTLVFVNIVFIDVSLNSFTGSIPSNLFNQNGRHKLKTAVLYSNCFTGSLPDSICESVNLTALVLDSASSSRGCNIVYPRILQDIFKVVIGKRSLVGSIPDCIFQMPSLQTLHLSGNGLKGSLPALDSRIQSLNDVSLASNAIAGTIPLSWQQCPWKCLDLSGNKLTGLLSDSFVVNGNNTVMDLTVNRLSGPIPGVFRYAPTTNILDGNLFQCQDSSKPEYDPNSDEYVCGSSNYNIALIFYTSALGALLLFGGWKLKQSVAAIFATYDELEAEAIAEQCAVRNVVELLTLFKRIFRVTKNLACVYVLLVMSSCILMKTVPQAKLLFSTHSEQYAWISTIAFVHGVLPLVLVTLYIFYSCATIAVGLDIRHSAVKSQLSRFYNTAKHATWSCSWRPVALFVLFFAAVIAHIVVMVTINIGYIYFLIHGVSTATLLTIQVSLSVFKLWWNNACVGWVVNVFNVSTWTRLFVSSFMVVFTFICSPLVATFFSDSTCFRYVITGQPPVTSTFLVNELTCAINCYGNLCLSFCEFSPVPSIVYATVVPSWLYSYQCSSSLLTNYTPVLLYSYAISGMLVPLVRLTYFNLSADFIDTRFPRVVRESLLMNLSSIHSYKANEIEDWDNDVVVAGTASAASVDSVSSVGSKAAPSYSIFAPRHRGSKRLFNATALVSRLVLNIGVMVTFGMASPLLAITICIDSYAMLTVWVGIIGRFLRIHRSKVLYPSAGVQSVTSTRSQSAFANAWKRLDCAIIGVPSGIAAGIWLIIVLTSWFWSLFVFDMMGDVYGDVVGGCVILLPTLGSYVVFVGMTVANDRWSHKFETPAIQPFNSKLDMNLLKESHSGDDQHRGHSVVELSVTNPVVWQSSQLNVNGSFT